MLMARTDFHAPKHAGISWFALPLDQPGVTIRPLREMTGRALFNEVFFDDARVPDAARIGDLGQGWAVANTTLANERAGLGSGGSGAVGGAAPGAKARMLGQRVGDLAKKPSERIAVSQPKSGKMMQDAAREFGVNDDASIRQRLAELYMLTEIGRFTALRSRAAKASGRGPGPEANTAKLMMSRITRLSRDLGLAIIGANGMLAGKDAPYHGAFQEMATFAPAVSIYGGSDEVQKNIIGERVLGLPKEPDADRNKTMPFRELRVATES
jgi:alkylation response protein AidB-like acyl-CoA dehydrogenase